MRAVLAAFITLVSAAPILAQPLRGTVEEHTFTHKPSGESVTFTIYLPEGYASSSRRYPVIYHLHGLGGNNNVHSLIVPRWLENANDAGVIDPAIIVFANGYEDSWWADSANSPKPAETDVVGRLVPYIDANYRTIDRRGARVIQGFSMGGFGAVKFFAKFNDIFSVCLEYDGAFFTWLGMRLLFPATAAEVFDNSESYFNQFSPWHQTAVNASVLRDGHPVRMVVGLLTTGNRNFRDHLADLDIPFDYVETSCGHDLECLLEAQGAASAAFIAARLDAYCSADFDRDGAVNSQDFFSFLTAFFASDPAADFNDDDAVNSQDLFDFLAAFFTPC